MADIERQNGNIERKSIGLISPVETYVSKQAVESATGAGRTLTQGWPYTRCGAAALYNPPCSAAAKYCRIPRNYIWGFTAG